MTNFIPGKIITSFTTKNGDKAIVRYPKWEDLDVMLEYINNLSQEDTFITYSGETIIKKEQMEFLVKTFEEMESLHRVFLCCVVGDQLAGTCEVRRKLTGKKRTRHVAALGIVIAKKFRGQGIGFNLLKTVIKEAKAKIPGLKMIALNVYEENEIAQSMYKKLGFREVARIPRAILYRGKYMDRVTMVMET